MTEPYVCLKSVAANKNNKTNRDMGSFPDPMASSMDMAFPHRYLALRNNKKRLQLTCMWCDCRFVVYNNERHNVVE